MPANDAADGRQHELPGPIGFVLGGGGGLGAVQVGMLQALRASGIEPDFLVGTSVGALNAAIFAAYPDDAPDRLAEIWLGMQREDIFTGNLVSALWHLSRTRTAAMPAEGLMRLAARTLDVSRFDELSLPLGVVAVSLTDGEEQVMTRGPIVPALLASTAIPGVFPPVVIENQLMVDGGVLANTPVSQAAEVGSARTLVVLDCTVPEPTTAIADVVEMLTVTTRLQARDQLRTALASVAPGTVVLSLPAPSARRNSMFDFDSTAELIDDARETTTAFLAELGTPGPGVTGDPFSRYVPHWAPTTASSPPRADAGGVGASTAARPRP